MDASELESIKEILKELKAKDGIVAVVGNHDYGIYSDPSHKRPSGEILSDVIKEEKTMGWNVLMDGNMKISRNQDSIAVVGVQNTSPSRHFHLKEISTKHQREQKGCSESS